MARAETLTSTISMVVSIPRRRWRAMLSATRISYASGIGRIQLSSIWRDGIQGWVSSMRIALAKWISLWKINRGIIARRGRCLSTISRVARRIKPYGTSKAGSSTRTSTNRDLKKSCTRQSTPPSSHYPSAETKNSTKTASPSASLRARSNTSFPTIN